MSDKLEKKRAYMAARYAADPERFKKAAAERRLSKPEIVKEENRAYRAANAENRKAVQLVYAETRREEKREYAKAYRAANPEKAKAAVAAWYAANPDAMKIKKINRRARLKQGGHLSVGITAKLMALQRGLCASCRCDLKTAGHHVDHIMPLAREGSNTDDNVQLLCPPCNLEKSAKHPLDWAKENGRLL